MGSGLWWIVVVAAFLGGSATAAPRVQGQPHLVLIVADDLGWNDVSWHNPQVVMPHLDRLAREGVILEQSYVQPICTPTRSALLTGRYPFTIGRQHGVLWPMEPTGLTLSATLLPEALKEAGYSTHIVGKWHLGFCNWRYTPTMRGFDTFYGYYTGAEDYYHHVRQETAREEVPNFMEPEPCLNVSRSGYDFRNNTTPDFDVAGKYSTYVFASYIEDLLSSRSPSDPLFLYLPFQSVHAPLQVPDNYTKPYSNIHHRERRIKLGMVTAMDEAVGRVVAALKSSGHYNNSVIVFTTDNGGPTVSAGNNWPLRGNKSTLWEGGTRGAAFVHSPLLEHSGTVSHKLIHVTDWYKTFVALAGGEAPSDTDGYDQWEALKGTSESPRRHMVYNIDNTTEFSAGIRFGDYKLLVGNPGPGEWIPPPEYFEDSDIELDLSNSTANSTDLLSCDNATEPVSDFVTESSTKNSIPTFPSSTSNTSFDEAAAVSTPQEPVTVVTANRRAHPNHILADSSVNATVETKEVDKDKETIDAEGGLEMKEKKMNEEIKKMNEEGLEMNEMKNMDEEMKNMDEEMKKVNEEGLELNEKKNMNEEMKKVNEEEGLVNDERDTVNKEEIRHEEKEKKQRKVKKYRITKKKLKALLDSQEIQLFNLLNDPEERTNLAERHPNIVRFLKGALLQEMARYVAADVLPNDPHGNPKNWHNIWSPGWCNLK